MEIEFGQNDPSLNQDEVPLEIQIDQVARHVNHLLSEKEIEFGHNDPLLNLDGVPFEIQIDLAARHVNHLLSEKEIEFGHNDPLLNLDEVPIEIQLASQVNHLLSEMEIEFEHKVKKGSFVNEDGPLGKVFGNEDERVRGLGFGPCLSKVFDNTPRMNEMHWSYNDNQMKDYVSNLEMELVATKAQLQAQNDMQKAMGWALIALLEKTFGKVPEEFATLLNLPSQPVPDDGSKHQSSQCSGKQYLSCSHQQSST